MAGKGGGGVRVTGWDWVGAEGAGPEVEAGCAGFGGGDAKLSGSKVSEGDGAEDGGDLAGLTVEAGWGVCRFISTRIATL